YVSSPFEEEEGFARLAERLRVFDRERGCAGNRLHYLAVPPGAVEMLVGRLREAGLVYPSGERCWSRVVVEKPFGRDLESARSLNRVLREHLDESQLYRIDHYLGKETVQNLLVFRFA